GAAGRRLALLAADGALGAADVAVLVEEVDEREVHRHPALGNLLGTALRNARLLARHLPDRAVLDVVHKIFLTPNSESCDLLSHSAALLQWVCFPDGLARGSPTHRPISRRRL